MKKIVVTGGGGYVGSMLVPKLLKLGYFVDVIDLFIYGEEVLEDHNNLRKIKVDIREIDKINSIIKNCNIFIHLACISNDPSFELNPDLGKSINLDAFEPLVKSAKENKVSKFLYASSSSVYGIKSEKDVSEDMTLEPITEYSIYKAECEKILNKYSSNDFIVTTLRPATVCGYAKRQRLDVVLNIFTNLAFHNREISVFGGDQLRPNINISDMVDAYIKLINTKNELINGEIFNVGDENLSIKELANLVKRIVGIDVNLKFIESNDNRSYHISSKKIQNKIGFNLKSSLKDGVLSLYSALENKLLHDPVNNPKYYNIKTMQKINLK